MLYNLSETLLCNDLQINENQTTQEHVICYPQHICKKIYLQINQISGPQMYPKLKEKTMLQLKYMSPNPKLKVRAEQNTTTNKNTTIILGANSNKIKMNPM